MAAVASAPPYVPPGHFYSPITSPADRQRAASQVSAPGVDLREAAQLALLTEIAPGLAEPFAGPRYSPANRMFGPADAAIYRSLLRRLQPSRVLEIGSGYSTALLLDLADDGLPAPDLVAVEPYPARLRGLLRPGDEDRLRLIMLPVQDVPAAEFDALGDGDLLFIDSTHVAKPGSDVLHLVLQVLPRLAPGVVVHVHDIFWPFTYPQAWLAEGRDWTEAYLLHAFLAGNSGWEILLFTSWAWHSHPEFAAPEVRSPAPGSLWLRKAAGTRTAGHDRMAGTGTNNPGRHKAESH